MREEHGIQCMPCSSQIISEMLPEIHTMQKFDFLKPILHSQIIYFSVIVEVSPHFKTILFHFRAIMVKKYWCPNFKNFT